MTRASNPAAPSGRWVRRSSAARRSAVDSTRTTSAPSGSGTSRFAATTVTCAPRSRAAAAIATPIRPVERLPMKRTGSIASRVPPALTTMCRPVRSASRGPATSGGRAAGSGGADRRCCRRPRPRRRRSSGSSASRPTPDWPDASSPGRGLHDRVAEVVAQSGDVGPRRRVGPHVAVHRRRDDDRGRRGEDRGGHDVAGQPVGHRAQPVRGRRRDDDRVGAVGDDDVADPPVGQQLEDVGLDRMARQRREGQRADEPRRGRASASRPRRRPRRAGAGAARRPCRRRSSR